MCLVLAVALTGCSQDPSSNELEVAQQRIEELEAELAQARSQLKPQQPLRVGDNDDHRWNNDHNGRYVVDLLPL